VVQPFIGLHPREREQLLALIILYKLQIGKSSTHIKLADFPSFRKENFTIYIELIHEEKLVIQAN
jgi:hypothetical protein